MSAAEKAVGGALDRLEQLAEIRTLLAAADEWVRLDGPDVDEAHRHDPGEWLRERAADAAMCGDQSCSCVEARRVLEPGVFARESARHCNSRRTARA